MSDYRTYSGDPFDENNDGWISEREEMDALRSYQHFIGELDNNGNYTAGRNSYGDNDGDDFDW